MKILFITPWYPYEGSLNHGIFVQDQAVAVSQDHEVIVIASEVDYQKFGICSFQLKVTDFKGVKEYRLSIRRSLPFYNQLNYFIITMVYAFKIARQFKPDIIHGNISYPGGVWSWMLAMIINRPFVITEHYSQFILNFRSWWHKKLTVLAVSKANTVISVSHYAAKEIFHEVRRTPVVIHNIIKVEEYKAISPLPVNDVWHIGFLGVLENEKKGLDILLEALSKVNAPYVLHVGGDGVLVPGYKKLAESLSILNKCIFHGHVMHYQVPEFMKRLHFFVSASRFESFGMVIVEAMASGLPVVVTDSGGPKDFVNTENGILVSINDVASLRGGIIKMIDIYDSFDAKRIRDYARRNFSSTVFRKKIAEVYDSFK